MAGNWWEDAPLAPAQPRVVPGKLVPVPKEPTPQTPVQAAKDAVDLKRAQVDLNNVNRPKPKEGFMFVDPTNPSAGQKQIPVIEATTDNPAKALATDEVLSAIDRARGQVNGWTTGLGGSIMGHVPGSDAVNLKSTLSTVGSQVTQGVLAELKSMSATGASGFGGLSDSEGRLLRDSIAALDTSQSGDQLKHNLDQVEIHFRRLKAIHAGEDPSKPDVQQKYGIAPLLAGETAKTDGGNGGGDGSKGYRFDSNAIQSLNAYLKTPGASAEGLKAFHDQLSGGQAIMSPEDASKVFKAGRLDAIDYSKIDAPQSSDIGEYWRRFKMGVGDIAQGAGDLAGVVANPLNAGLNMTGIPQALTGAPLGTDLGSAARSALGAPTPESNGEKLASAINRGAVMAAAPSVGAGMAAPYFGGSGGAGLARIGATPMLDTVTGMGGAGSAETARQKGASPVGQMIAGLAGGGAALAGASGLARAYAPAAVSGARTEANNLVQAGQAEGVNVNRAMVDPNLESKVTRTQGSLFGGNRVTRDMATVSGQIENGVNRLGNGGTALEPQVAGQTIQTASERYIKQSGQVAKRQYDKAEKLAGDVRIQPTQATAEVDGILQRLSETPGTNAKEISYLQTLKGDLSKPISVGALRDLRTTLRKQVANGDLTFGQNEARVLGVMDTLSGDIETGLAAAGKADAAAAFKSADTAYRQRMSFINDTVQKLIGKRNSNTTPEQTLSKFQAMATPKGDEAGLGKMMAQMEPDEAADIRATLASTLGKNNKGEFSPAILAANAEKLPQAARVHIFGQDGADSIDRLVSLSKAANRVTSQFNHSKSGVARAGDAYRGAVMAVTGLGTGAGVGNVISGVAATAVAGGAMAARDALSAKALMSTNLTKWLARTPTSAADINRHIQQLSVVAAREPAIANEVLSLQARLADSFGSAPARLAADEGTDSRRPVNRGQRNGGDNRPLNPAVPKQAPQSTGAPMQ